MNELIKDKIQGLDPEEMEELTAALLRAMGYQRASGGFPGQHHGLTAGLPGYAEAGSDAHGGGSSAA